MTIVIAILLFLILLAIAPDLVADLFAIAVIVIFAVALGMAVLALGAVVMA